MIPLLPNPLSLHCKLGDEQPACSFVGPSSALLLSQVTGYLLPAEPNPTLCTSKECKSKQGKAWQKHNGSYGADGLVLPAPVKD